MHPVVVVLFTVGTAWLIWSLARDFFIRSPIDNIPGPPSPSLLRGMLVTITPYILSILTIRLSKAISVKSITEMAGDLLTRLGLGSTKW